MLHQMLETDFLSELSDEQQQTVAGGGQLAELQKKIKTVYDASKTIFTNTVGSGPEGSFVNTEIVNTAITTNADEMLNSAFPGDESALGTISY